MSETPDSRTVRSGPTDGFSGAASSLRVTGIELLETVDKQDLEHLRQDVIAASYLRGNFTLQSLGSTSYYFDKYYFVTRPAILRRLVRQLSQLVEDRAQRLACTELGSVPLATGVSLQTGLPFLIVRLAPRDGRSFEGELSPGDRVTLLEDVVATGKHALDSIARLRTGGAIVEQIVAVVDRDEGARSRLEEAGCRLTSLFEVSGDLSE